MLITFFTNQYNKVYEGFHGLIRFYLFLLNTYLNVNLYNGFNVH